MVATEINGLEEVTRYYYATKKLSCSLILDDYMLIEGLTAEEFKELEGFVYHPKREHFIVNQLCDTECKKFIAGSVDLIYKISPGKFSATVTDQISGFSGNLIFTVKNGLIEILETRKIVNWTNS